MYVRFIVFLILFYCLFAEPLLEFVERYTVFYANIAKTSATELGKIGTTAEGSANISCEGSDVCSLATLHTYLCLHPLCVKPQEFYLFYVDRFCIKLHLFAFSPQLIGTITIFLYCAIGGRHLHYVALKVLQHLIDALLRYLLSREGGINGMLIS